MWKLEQSFIRKNIVICLMDLGIAVTLVLLYVMLNEGVQVIIEDCSVSYKFESQRSLNFWANLFILNLLYFYY